jgi:hypothetical protein
MKKTLFALFAVLLASFLATCDLLEPPPDVGGGLPDSTEDGMVRLAINVADGEAGRSLTLAQAKDKVNYYEVVFYDGTNYYETKWSTGKGVITIPTGEYTNVADGPKGEGAVLFAGHYDDVDYTLLAVGIISGIDGERLGPSDPALITSETDSVTFTLTALKNNVSNVTGDEQNPSTFQLLGPTSSINYSTATGNPSPHPIGVASGGLVSGYPTFFVPARSTAFPNPPVDTTVDTSSYIVGQYKVKCGDNNANFAGVILGGYTVKSPTGPYDIFSIGDGLGLTEVEGVPRKPAVNEKLTSGEFVFYIDVSKAPSDTPDTGYCLISIDASVYALTDEAIVQYPDQKASTITWHIRGGTENAKADGGISEGSPGGAIILGVGLEPPP